jgi:glutamine synthetase
VSAAHNPYLTLAAYITAGLDGVKNKLDPGMPFIGTNLYEVPTEELRAKGIDILPQSQYEALEALKEDTVVQSALGPIADEFIRLKKGEWREYHRTVSQWEVERYLTLF